jgi:cadmium resistance protein CadD (predicted permease)
VTFIKYLTLTCGFTALSLALLLLTDLLSARDRSAVVLGGIVATANAVLAYLLVLLSARRSARAFMGIVLGGMLGRMTLMLAAVFFAVVSLELPSVPLAVSLLGYFSLFLALELAVLHRRANRAAAQP